MNPLRQYIKERLERLEKENEEYKRDKRFSVIKEHDLYCAYRILDPLEISLSYDEYKDHCVITIKGTIPTEIHLGRTDPEEVRELQNFITRLHARKGRYL